MPLRAGSLARGGIISAQEVQKVRGAKFNRVVRLLLFVNQERKRDPRFFSKHFRILRIPKTHRRKCRPLRSKFLLVRAQLRDVFPAENSTVVPQKHHYRRLRRPQRPQPDLSSIRVRQHNHRQSAAQ